MTGGILARALSYFGTRTPKRRNYGSGRARITVAEYESINPLSDAQVAHFIEHLKRETEFHPMLLADISPPIDRLKTVEESAETASAVCGFINLYLVKNGLHKKGPNLGSLGQLRRAASKWGAENLPQTESAPKGQL